MASSSSSSSSSRNWVYDVFPSFSGEDVRKNFLSHFLKELDRKLIIAFKDNEIERSQSLDPELKRAIRTSRIAMVVFSEKYASSSWCLNELLEIVKCKEEFGDQMVIPVFYGLDPFHVRKQTGEFGKIFGKTCKNKTKEVKVQWKKALTDVANILGYHSMTWGNEAKLIESIVDDILIKLLLTTSKDFEEFVGMEDHIAKMSVLLKLESKEVRMVGIWGSSGIGKTTIARVLFNRLYRNFQGRVFIDRAFISKSMEKYGKANPDDYNMKLHLQRNFLSEILCQKHIKIDHLDAVGMRLKHQKVLIFIDDLDDHMVLEALVGQPHWFGCGSRIIAITKDKHLLRAHGIDYIYEVCLPSYELALKIFCRYAFRQDNPPDGFMEFASEVAFRAGNLPLGLNVLGLSLRGRNKKYWTDMLPRLRNSLDGNIEKTLKVSYDGLNYKKDEAIFRHVACLFNGEKINDIKLLLADSDLDVNVGLENLVDKSLIHVRFDTVEMHRLLQDMGKEIVRSQSIEPGEREFLVDPKDICNVLKHNTGTKKALGISLDMDETDELHIHESAFKGMPNLFFLKIYTKIWDQKKEVRWHFDYLPPKLRFLRLDGYQMRCLPSNFCPENLVKLQMPGSKLEKLWEGVHALTALKNMDLSGSQNLKEIPNLSMATNLETLRLDFCWSLVELPSSIQYLNKLNKLGMSFCKNLKTLPTGINLKSLHSLDLNGCSRLRSFPDISTNISDLLLNETGMEEVPSWIENFSRLEGLSIDGCNSLLRVSLNVSKLEKLRAVEFADCGALSETSWYDSTSEEEIMSTNNIHPTIFVDEDGDSSSLPDGEGYFYLLNLNLINCSNLDPEALIKQQSVFMALILSGEEVPSYFTHRTTGTSLTNIPLSSPSPLQPLFSFRCCAVVDAKSVSTDYISFEIEVRCRFIDRFGNLLESVDLRQADFSVKLTKLGVYLAIFDIYFPRIEELAPLFDQLNHGHMDIEFCLIDMGSPLQLKGCGIQLAEYGNGPCEGNTSNGANLEGHEAEDSQECGDSAVERNGSSSNNANLEGHEIEQSQECGDSTVERKSTGTKRGVIKKLLSCYAANPQDP